MFYCALRVCPGFLFERALRAASSATSSLTREKPNGGCAWDRRGNPGSCTAHASAQLTTGCTASDPLGIDPCFSPAQVRPRSLARGRSVSDALTLRSPTLVSQADVSRQSFRLTRQGMWLTTPCFHVCVSRCGPEADGPLFCVAILVDAAVASAALLVRHRAPRGRRNVAHRRCALAAALSPPS